MSFKRFVSIFSSGSHFVQSNITIFAILVEGHPRKISVKLFEIGHRSRRLCHLKVFLFLAIMAILSHLSNFGRGSPKENFY